MTGNKLFVEVSHSLLAPVLNVYQEVDRLLPSPTVRQLARLARRCLRQLPKGLLGAPFSVARTLVSPLARELHRARQQREITMAVCGSTTERR